jgi:hypothetical protein
MRSPTVLALIVLGSSTTALAEPKQEESSGRVSLKENDATNDPPRVAAEWVELADPTPAKHGKQFIIVGRESGYFSRLRVDAAKGRTYVRHVRVLFDDGTSKTVRLERAVSTKKRKSAIIDIADEPRAIAQIIVTTDREGGQWSLYGIGTGGVVGSR